MSAKLILWKYIYRFHCINYARKHESWLGVRKMYYACECEGLYYVYKNFKKIELQKYIFKNILLGVWEHLKHLYEDFSYHHMKCIVCAIMLSIVM